MDKFTTAALEKLRKHFGVRGTGKNKGTMSLNARIIVGPETAKELGVPVGSEIDLGEISRSEFDLEVKSE